MDLLGFQVIRDFFPSCHIHSRQHIPTTLSPEPHKAHCYCPALRHCRSLAWLRARPPKWPAASCTLISSPPGSLREPSDHVTPVPRTSQWLLNSCRVKAKVLIMALKALRDQIPSLCLCLPPVPLSLQSSLSLLFQDGLLLPLRLCCSPPRLPGSSPGSAGLTPSLPQLSAQMPPPLRAFPDQPTLVFAPLPLPQSAILNIYLFILCLPLSSASLGQQHSFFIPRFIFST